MKPLKAKFKYLLITLFIFTSLPAFSQLKNFGVKGGLNLSNAEINYRFTASNFNKENKTGFNAYLFYDFLNFKNVIITAEAGYSQKGYTDKFEVTNEFGNYESTVDIYNRLNYIDLNIVTEFILRNKSVSPYFSLGPVLSI